MQKSSTGAHVSSFHPGLEKTPMWQVSALLKIFSSDIFVLPNTFTSSTIYFSSLAQELHHKVLLLGVTEFCYCCFFVCLFFGQSKILVW